MNLPTLPIGYAFVIVGNDFGIVGNDFVIVRSTAVSVTTQTASGGGGGALVGHVNAWSPPFHQSEMKPIRSRSQWTSFTRSSRKAKNSGWAKFH